MNTHPIRTQLLPVVALFALILASCSKDEAVAPTPLVPLTTAEQDMLRFMLEEEKLARDTYTALEAQWGTAVFTNIKASEQQHMDQVVRLLDRYGVAYTLLPAGVYADSSLQQLYDQFMVDGQVSELQALHIGATIEDLDIVDLQQRMDATANVDIDAVFAKLQCGSGNHLRSFVGVITTMGGTYTPQFLDPAAYAAILAASNGSCGGA